jgi:hypothetical protein
LLDPRHCPLPQAIKSTDAILNGGGSHRWLSVRENSSQKHRSLSGQQHNTTATPVDNDHFIDAGMDEEAKQLLREIRDLMAGSQARYDHALAESKRAYQDHFAKMRRAALIFALVFGGLCGLMAYLAR